jgi:DNA (cytosine-5)-methyltransferase 1
MQSTERTMMKLDRTQHTTPVTTPVNSESNKLRFIDLFCGIGGFRLAADSLGWKCVFSSDIDMECQRAYEANFGEKPAGDIKQVSADEIPDHEILLAGFPCQPFSICGEQRGFSDTRGTLFFEIARIIEDKKPAAFILENVKMLVGHDNGKTFSRIIDVLQLLKYTVHHRVLNALDFGLPQKRERVFIVGFRDNIHFSFPQGGRPMRPLTEILEKDVPEKHFASEEVQRKRREAHPNPCPSPAIWHENKGGHISSYPFSCALRAGASYNYLLVDGIRRLTPREMLRLQGFPDSYRIACNDFETRKQAGNSVAVPVVKAVLDSVDFTLNLAMAISHPNKLVSARNELKRDVRCSEAHP